MDTQRKAELKKQYKQAQPKAGVFKIVNLRTGRLFIGNSMNLRAIFNRYKAELRNGGCKNKELQRDWNELGVENFQFEVLEALDPEQYNTDITAKDLAESEALWLEELRPFGEKGYNKPPVA